MPNWCNNVIIVRGPKESLRKLDEQFKRPHTIYYGGTSYLKKEEYEKVKKRLDKEVEEGKILDYKIGKARDTFGFYNGLERWECTELTKEEEVEGYSFSNIIPMTREDFLNGWHEWSIENWGTKWDASHIQAGYKEDEEDEEGEIIYSFETAWSPAIPIVARMSELYPELQFSYEFVEFGVCFAGIFKYEDGELIKALDYDGDGGGLKEFLHEHLGYEYFRCVDCNQLLEEWEFGDNYEDQDFEEGHICPHCGSKNVKDVAGNLIE